MRSFNDYPALADDRTGALGVDDALTAGPMVPAFVERDGEHLVWDWIHPRDDWRRPRTVRSDRLLDEFLRLRQPDDVAPFAAKFGSIMICEHGVPATHRRDLCKPFVGLTGPFREPLDRWLHYSSLARGLMEVASHVFDDPPRCATRETWESIYEDVADSSLVQRQIKGAAESPTLGRLLLIRLIQEWLDTGDVGPRLELGDSDDGPPALKLAAGTFGLIGLQLVQAVTRARDLTNCSGCGLFYERRGRRAKSGQRNYCDSCRQQGIDARDRQRVRRARAARGGEEDDGA